MAVAALSSLGFAAVTVLSLGSIGPIQGSAYGSIVAVLFGAVAVLAVANALMLIAVAARVVAGSPAVGDAFQVTRIYAIYLLLVWIVVAAVVLFGQRAVPGAG